MVKFLQGHKAAEDGVYIHNSHHSVSYDPGLSLKQVLDCVLFWFYPHRKSTMQVLVLLTFCGWEGWDSKLAPSARVKLTSTSKTAFNHSPVVFKVGSRPAMPALSGSLWDRQILGPCQKPIEAETPGFGPVPCVSGTPPVDLQLANV